MATTCTNCGHDLPRDDAHFCTHCGTLVPSHPFSAQSLSAANAANVSTRKDDEKPVVSEQIAHKQPEKPVLREQRVQQPRQRTTRRIAPDSPSAPPIAWPAPITHVSVKEASAQQERGQVVPQEFSPTPSAHVPSSERELHVKVWQNNPPTPLPESAIELGERDIEDAPTVPLEMPEQSEKEGVSSHESDASSNDVEQIDTTSLPIYAQTQSAQQSEQVSHSPRSIHDGTPVSTLPDQSRQQRQQNHPNTPIPTVGNSQQSPVNSSPQYATGQRSQAAFIPPVQERRIPTTSTSSSRHQKSPVPFIILLALVGILILGGGAWVLLAQPFSVSPITQPLQDFKNTGLGIALSYPTSWTVQQTASSALFADSSHTGQVKIQAADTTSDAATYVQQQAKKSGMTAIKPLGTTSFAGLAWQQVQGNVQQDGANYTTTMFATTHGNRMYLLTQMAPQNVYADEESVVFSAMRHSFKFL